MAEMTTLTLDGAEQAEALVARPSGDAHAAGALGGRALPGVLLFMDAIGLRPQIADMADRIASWGYVVLAPNVLHQFGTAEQTRPSVPLSTPELRTAFFRTATPRLHQLFAADNREHLLGDLRAYAAALHALPGVDAGPIGITSYCMGARLAVLTAGELGEGVAAVGGFHAGNVALADDPLSPHLALSRARAEFWFGHAQNDPSMDAGQQARLERALADAGVAHGMAEYDGAPHGFTMADTASYHAPSADRHWRDLHDLLTRALPSPAAAR